MKRPKHMLNHLDLFDGQRNILTRRDSSDHGEAESIGTHGFDGVDRIDNIALGQRGEENLRHSTFKEID